MSCWGHPAARRALDRRSFPRAFKNAPVACQFTSIGATSERWIAEMADSFGGGRVAMDGGDIVFHGFEDGVVFLTMQGACAGCPSSTATLKMGIENLLRHYVPEVDEVQAVV